MSKTIWFYSNVYPTKINEDFQLSIGEGDTPLETIEINNYKFFIKREDLNPSGSFKDRSLAFQLSYYYSKGETNFALSTSGNAGNSLVNFAKKYPFLNVHIFYSTSLSENKRIKLSEILNKNQNKTYKNIHIYFSENPKKESINFAKKNNIIHLRPSYDSNAIYGYHSLACELKDIDSSKIYILSSSGNAILGIANKLLDFGKEISQINIIQIPKIHPIVKKLNGNILINEEESEVNCVVDRVANRIPEILQLANKTKATGKIIYNDDIMYIRKKLSEINSSYQYLPSNTLATLAIAYKDYEHQIIKGTTPICIFSGI